MIHTEKRKEIIFFAVDFCNVLFGKNSRDRGRERKAKKKMSECDSTAKTVYSFVIIIVMPEK
jgi:hypothetical protein